MLIQSNVAIQDPIENKLTVHLFLLYYFINHKQQYILLYHFAEKVYILCFVILLQANVKSTRSGK